MMNSGYSEAKVKEYGLKKKKESNGEKNEYERRKEEENDLWD